MYARRLSLMVVVVTLLVALVVPAAHAQQFGTPQFLTANTDCEMGIFTVIWPDIPVDVAGDSVPSDRDNMVVTATDAEGTHLGQDYFAMYEPGETYTGTIVYGSEPVDSVTFRLYAFGEFDIRGDAAAQVNWGVLLDTRVVPVDCDEALPVPGCDLMMYMPAHSVVGLFLATTPTDWLPGKQTENPVVVIPGGKTAWVLGQDETEEYYKIVWSCDYLWVPKTTMGPNPDDVWMSTPLPTEIVE